jgi:hypothetical protein
MKVQAPRVLCAALATFAVAAGAQSPPPELALRWTVDRTLVTAPRGALTRSLALTLVTLSETGWTAPRMLEAATEAGRLLAPCDIALDRIEVLAYAGGPTPWRDLWTPASREFARFVAPARPAVFFVAGTWHRPAFDAEAFGRPNTATRPELVHTVWVTAAARDLPIVIAHELVHVLSGSGEHSGLPGNLMREDTAPGATALTPAQCADLRDHAVREGLLRAATDAARQAPGAVRTVRGTTSR